MTVQVIPIASSPAFARCLPFGLFIALLALSSIVVQPWLVIVRNLLVASVLLFYWKYYVELRVLPARRSDWFLALTSGVAVFVAWTLLDHDWIVTGGAPGFRPLLPTGEVDWLMAALRLVGFALVVPVMEELFWRSFLLRWLEQHEFLSFPPSRVGLRALVITAALFALEHNQWVAGAVASIVYSALYMRSGNLWVPIAAHTVTNLALGTWVIWTRNWQFW